MIRLLGGIFLGWSLGANDGANLFGTAVQSKMVKFWTAAFLASGFVILGAVLEGRAGIETLETLTFMDTEKAIMASAAAAVTVTIMTLFRLPVSTSQAVVGAILGAGFLQQNVNIDGLVKILICWVGTPIGGMLFAFLTYQIFAIIYNLLPYNLFQKDMIVRTGLIVAGCYSAYALGSNNVANVTGFFVGSGDLDIFMATLIGGVSIALGILTFSRGVMETVGKKLLTLDPFSAMVAVTAEALTVHFYTLVGVPVSTSQAIIGAILGIGILKGIKTLRIKTLFSILVAWFLTPAVGCFVFFVLHLLFHLQYAP